MTMILENYAELLEDLLGKVFDKTIKKQPDYVGQLFNVQSTNKYIERRLGMGEMGLMQEWKSAGRQVPYEDVEKGFPVTYQQEKYALGFEVEEDLLRFDRKDEIVKKPRKLARAVHNTKQYHGISIFGQAFSKPNGPDGKSLCATDHPVAPGSSTTNSNKFTYTLTYENVDRIITYCTENWTDDKGNLILPNFDTIIVPRGLLKAARVIADSDGEPDTSDNNVNIYKGSFNVICIPLLATWSPTAWFLVDSERMKEYLNWLEARTPKLERDRSDFNREVLRFKTVGNWAFGYDDWSWIAGSTGTSPDGQ